jgi:hypothetical protein
MAEDIISGREHAYEGHGGYPRPDGSNNSAPDKQLSATAKSAFTGKRTTVEDEVARFTGQIPPTSDGKEQ